MFGLGTKEILLIALVLVLLFGAKRIPALAKSIGDSIRQIRGSVKDEPKQ